MDSRNKRKENQFEIWIQKIVVLGLGIVSAVFKSTVFKLGSVKSQKGFPCFLTVIKAGISLCKTGNNNYFLHIDYATTQ